MKISKAEKIWLIAVVLFYALYNLPYYPIYGDSDGLIAHGLLTLIPLWIAVFGGVYFINKSQPLRDEDSIEDTVDDTIKDTIDESLSKTTTSINDK